MHRNGTGLLERGQIDRHLLSRSSTGWQEANTSRRWIVTGQRLGEPIGGDWLPIEKSTAALGSHQEPTLSLWAGDGHRFNDNHIGEQ